MWYYTEVENKEEFIEQFMPSAKHNTEEDFLYNPRYKEYEYICFESIYEGFFFRQLHELMEYADSDGIVYVDLTVKQMEIE